MTLESRFWAKVDRRDTDECWPWLAATNEHGYGVMRPDGHRAGATIKASRVSLILAGRDPGDLHALHTCDNPVCVNPQHLFAGMQADNVADMHAKGRGNIGSVNGQAKMTEVLVGDIRARVAAGETQKSLCKEYGITKGTMSYLVNGKTWRHVEATLA